MTHRLETYFCSQLMETYIVEQGFLKRNVDSMLFFCCPTIFIFAGFLILSPNGFWADYLFSQKSQIRAIGNDISFRMNLKLATHSDNLEVPY